MPKPKKPFSIPKHVRDLKPASYNPRRIGADALPETAPDPVAIQRAYEQGLKTAQASVLQSHPRRSLSFAGQERG